jgi:hypothetical protein
MRASPALPTPRAPPRLVRATQPPRERPPVVALALRLVAVRVDRSVTHRLVHDDVAVANLDVEETLRIGAHPCLVLYGRPLTPEVREWNQVARIALPTTRKHHLHAPCPLPHAPARWSARTSHERQLPSHDGRGTASGAPHHIHCPGRHDPCRGSCRRPCQRYYTILWRPDRFLHHGQAPPPRAAAMGASRCKNRATTCLHACYVKFVAAPRPFLLA